MDLSPAGLIAGGRAVVGYDVTGAALGHAPAGAQLAGYSTGTGGIAWTAAQWTAHPGAVRIDQDPFASDPTADVLDVENGAATFADCPGWVRRALADYQSAARPGQRSPAIYASASNITIVANQLVGAGITGGVGLWVADWGFTQAQAFADVVNAAGPFPVVAVQWRSLAWYDEDVFSAGWLDAVSGHRGTEHYTAPGDTLGSVAAGRSMKALAWLALQQRLHPDDAENLAGGAAPKPGSRWWIL
jgi:hypothetical protein